MYKWDAKDYHKSSSEQQKWAQELILKLSLKGSERVLDIGCGDGKITAEISMQLSNGSVVGVDKSEEMIHFARENFPSERFPNLIFKVMDAKNLGFNGEFDVVFSNASLHWVIDQLSVLKGIKKSLRPSGKILLQMGGRGNVDRALEIVETMIKSRKWNRYFTNSSFPYGFYGPEEYKTWLECTGLKARRIELIPKDMILKGKEGITAFVRTTGLGYTRRIPERLHEEFVGEIVDRYIKNHPIDNEGLIHVQMIRLEVEAENEN